jgi:flagellin
MSNISLSLGVRSALSSLSSVSSDARVSQNRLATGKRVNSAVDNAVNFFTSASLNDRANQFSGLLDGMSNAVQTIQGASKGIDSVIKLVQTAQSTVKQAQADALANRPTKTTAALTTAAESALTGKSIKDTTLDKTLEGTAATATASAVGALGVTASSVVTLNQGNSTYSFTTSTTTTVRDFVNEVNKSGVATAAIDDAGKLTITGAGSGTLKVSVGNTSGAPAGASNAALGLAAGDWSTGITASGTSAVRSNLIDQFNSLTKQIDNLAKDAGFNGTNLLGGDKLSIIFNEKTGSAQNKLDVQGQTINSANLGIGTAASSTASGNINFQNDTELSTAADTLTAALSSLRSFASTLGSNLAVVQTRQDFTKGLVDTLKNGADNLVLADPNQEAATLLALQTRQQLSQTALSLSNQADQAILRLF